MNRRISALAAIILSMVVVAGSQASTPMLQDIERKFEAGRYAEVVHALEPAIQQTPQDAKLHFWLARSAYEMQQYDTAIHSAERACQLEPANSEFRLWLARAVGRKAERDRSFFMARRFRRELEEAVRLGPSNIRARRDLAEFYAETPWVAGGSKTKARQQAEAIAQIDPLEGLLAWADYYRNVGEPAESARLYHQMLEQKSSRAPAYFEAVDFFESRSDSSEMELFLEQAARLAPGDPRLIYYRGVARMFGGKAFPEAEKDLKTYIAMVPNRSDLPRHADVHERLGQLYEKMGGHQRAAEEYRAALELEPDRRISLDGLRRVTR